MKRNNLDTPDFDTFDKDVYWSFGVEYRHPNKETWDTVVPLLTP